MADPEILSEIRKYRKLSQSPFGHQGCSARYRAEKLMEEYGVTEDDLKEE
ncbi:MAG TPA: hypothetical protein O0X25_01440 [Methanocorpusculum sp.]|nr:hypothetical protein [Methanocorpusculum sp.]HJJ39660.1 hypothetical protein [Methanocorpusculum sp.]HJJ49269.1 hypothetical protein [Methanocorpusculum sp.]HJJ56687.1 hypothetical protein [Methanocorpusculum sp.]HJJ95119.1 hypothetical protein [Methanocorpusculum sp.]